jgi:hypothetical protein
MRKYTITFPVTVQSKQSNSFAAVSDIHLEVDASSTDEAINLVQRAIVKLVCKD